MNIVIGSGPAGIACVHSLLEKGKDVQLIDAGIELEQEQTDLLAKIAAEQNSDAFDKLKTIQSNPKLGSAGLHTKLVFGSDFPYRGAKEYLGFESSGTGLAPSLATGGLSNVWGSATLPYQQSDIQDWPVTAADLAPHYEKIIEITGLSAQKDDLSELFPLYTKNPHPLKSSTQTSRLLKGLEGIRVRLKSDGITYGSSRLMVGPSQSNNQECVYCSQCIYGCPYGCIYNSRDDLRSLLKKGHPRFKYLSDTIVTSLKEKGETVTVSGFNRLSKAAVTLEAERVFLAAGVIPSTRIMLKSLELYDQPIELKDNQYFLFPIVSIKGNKEAVKEAAYTLSQLFIEIQDQDISPNTIHLQFYTYNDIITKTLEQKFWFLPWLRRPLIRFLEHRLIIVQGYLHSRHSGKIRLSLHRDSASFKERLAAEGVPSSEARKMVGSVIKKIGKHFLKLGMFPIANALEFCLPGRGFHSGGSFPMRAAPGPLESDIYGRIGGASRIHVVDASIFPSIPATTITFTAMANAHRIGSQDY